LAYRLTNSTSELENRELNKERQDEIIQPNSCVVPSRKKASDINLESVQNPRYQVAYHSTIVRLNSNPKLHPHQWKLGKDD